MIFAKNRDALKYLGLNENLDTALRRIAQGLDGLQPGHYDMDGDNLWLNCFEYETLPEDQCFYEAHHKFGDIHIMLQGCEKVSIADPQDLEEFKSEPENDFYAYHGSEALDTFVMRPGTFLVVFPGDAHDIKMRVHGPEQVRKAVFKFKL